MLKKVLSLLMAVSMLVCAMSFTAMAKMDENQKIEAARKAILKGSETLTAENDMTMDEFIKLVKPLIPDDCSDVELSFDKESDFRVYKATSEKDGSIFANILFTCTPYTRHEMFTVKIPALTGDAAAANADKEKLAADMSAAREVFKNVSLDPDITEEGILEMIRPVIKNGSVIEATGDFTKVDSTVAKKGSVKCFVKFTLNNETDTLKVYNTLRVIDHDLDNDEVTADDNKTTDDNNTTEVKNVSFTDVADDAYYANPVKWAVEKNITQGTSATTFSPDLTCTRAQILTFLWRAVGSPASETANPFTDVTKDDYFYNAAIWAYEKGMVEGTEFEGNTPCTRASTVTYLWKNDGAPISEDFASFTDVSDDADYAEAVSWAVENNVTSGVSDTEFAPDTICSRGQIVTFLSRAIG